MSSNIIFASEFSSLLALYFFENIASEPFLAQLLKHN